MAQHGSQLFSCITVGRRSGKRQEKTKFIRFWSIGSLRKKSPVLLSVSLGSRRTHPSSLLPWSQKQPCTTPNCSRSSRARHLHKSRCLPMKRAQQHCYWAQHLLTGLKGLRGQVTMEERIFMAPVWAGAGTLQPASLVDSTEEASRTTLARLLRLPSPSSAAPLVYSSPILQKMPGARQRGCLPAGPGVGKGREHPSATQVGSCCGQAAKSAALCDPSRSGGIGNVTGRARHKAQ